MGDGSRRNTDAASTARLGGAIPQVNASLGRAFHERVGSIAGADEDEVRRALPAREPQTVAGGVQERLRLRDLPDIFVDMSAIGEGREDGDGRRDVDAVHRDGEPNRIESIGSADY